MTEPSDQAETLVGDSGSGRASDNGRREPTPQLLGDRYLLEEPIASGGMASVWRAHDEVLARTVAVKVLHDHLAADAAFRERFRREAVAAAKLSHPNVVGLYDTGTDGDRVWIVMEFVDGVTLRDVIADVGRLEPGEAAAIGEKVARALDYAHERGLIHRDIKPANILIGHDGTVKVADFGIAKLEEDAAPELTKTGMVLGTAAYVSPEQLLAEPITGKADQYALGCVLYEALTGQRAFKGESAVATAALRLEQDPLPVRSIRTDVPRGLDAAVLTAMSRDADQRYPTAGQLADVLLAFADGTADPTGVLTGPNDHPVDAAGFDDGGQGRSARRESFLRSEARWLAPVGALLLLAVALVVVGLRSGVLEPGVRLPTLFAQDSGPSPQDTEAGPTAGVALPIAAIASLDPEGSPQTENDDELRLITDGDPATAWATDHYDSAAFGNLKTGLGVFADLGSRQDIARIVLSTPTPGFAYEIRVADAPSDTLDGWRVVGRVARSEATTTTVLEQPVSARYVMIWVTGTLQNDGRGYVASIADLAVIGA